MSNYDEIRRLAREVYENGPDDWPSPRYVGWSDETACRLVSALNPRVVLEMIERIEGEASGNS